MRKTLSALVAVVVVVGGVAIGYGVVTRSPRVDQPIAFNHVIHLGEASLQCVDCHLNAESTPFAGIPGKQICLDCHDIDDEQGSNIEKDKLFAFAELDGDIPWKRVAITRPDVFFSHRRHVTSAKLECLTCHKDQDTLIAPPRTSRHVMPMADCVNCHAEHAMPKDCNACHR